MNLKTTNTMNTINRLVGLERGTQAVSPRVPLVLLVRIQLTRLKAMSASVMKSGDTPIYVPHLDRAKISVTAAVPARSRASGTFPLRNDDARLSVVPTVRRLSGGCFVAVATQCLDPQITSTGSRVEACAGKTSR
jgi:hypothetical protein